MKKVLLFLISIFLFGSFVFAGEITIEDVPETLVIKGEDHIVGQKILKDDAGNTVVVRETRYVQVSVVARLVAIEKRITDLKDPNWIAQQIAKLMAEKVKLQAVKQKIADSMK